MAVTTFDDLPEFDPEWDPEQPDTEIFSSRVREANPSQGVQSGGNSGILSSGLTPQQEEELEALLELEDRERVFSPQAGPQEMFLKTRADIALYGGAAGGGKTHALLLENLRHVKNGKFGSVIFRRLSNQVMTEGGLWDNAHALYPLRGAKAKKTPRPVMEFPSGARVSFAHLQFENDVESWQGAQIPLICFDELTHFTHRQFFYMLSRNRSTCGVRPYIRATTNPDADSWVAKFIEWYIDQTTGFAIPERSGKIRFFIVLDDEVKWGDSREEVAQRNGVPKNIVKTFTFIASSVYDNKVLLEKNPEYIANLHALSPVEKGRLLGGNWKIRPAAGMYFRREQVAGIVNSIEELPGKIVKICRAWDLAASEPTAARPSPDATSGTLIARLDNGQYAVLDEKHACVPSSHVRNLVKRVAADDDERFPGCKIRLPQDPGQAGKEQGQSYVAMLAGFVVKVVRVTGDKVTRAEPYSSQWQAKNVWILRGAWNERYFMELESFPDPSAHDDSVDSSADAFSEVALGKQIAIITETSSVTYDEIMNNTYGAGFGFEDDFHDMADEYIRKGLA